MLSLIISRLIETNHKIYFPLERDSTIVIETPDGDLLRCELQHASIDTARSPIARGIKDDKAQMLGVVDGVTRTVWIIPRTSIEGRQAIRLGQRYEDYIIPEPLSLCYKEQKDKRKGVLDDLKERARMVGSREEIEE